MQALQQGERTLKFINHPSNNHLFGAPLDWDHDKAPCDTLPVTVAIDEELGPTIRSYWRPTEAELAELNAGGSLCLTIVGNGMPPVALFVVPKHER